MSETLCHNNYEKSRNTLTGVVGSVTRSGTASRICEMTQPPDHGHDGENNHEHDQDHDHDVGKHSSHDLMNKASCYQVMYTNEQHDHHYLGSNVSFV